ncbi:hypothetical protein BDA99DRAFT_575659 [Phascolomyces articulosus]|uniref:F-box domain-containing protein n=1 Tax=Phascolomyces articulosus TaxID=60185 RepID=A0AAD5JQK6_9FUNG|nr:hypothetical protein BDA99DRAFT_575659 [Phascolomyces articulosus]
MTDANVLTTQIPWLPVEIQEAILRSLTFHDRLECSATCKTWRTMVLNWSGMWRNLSTDDEHTIIPHLRPYQAYIIPSSVRRIQISDYYNGDRWREIEDFLFNQLKCNAIQEIEVRTEYLAMKNISRLLSNCGTTLTRICFTPPRGEIQFERFPTDVTPDLFLHHCPNLVDLTFVYAVSSKAAAEAIKHPAITESTKNPYLTNITLSIDDYNFNPEPFLKVAPNLKRLALLLPDISRMDATTFISMLYQHCPHLISLALSSNAHHLRDLDITNLHELRQNGDVIQQPLDNTTSSSKGFLMNLLLHDSLNMYRLAPLLLSQFIVQQKHTQLVSLDLAGDAFVNQEIMNRFIEIGGFPSVTHLTLRYDKSNSLLTLYQFLGNFVPNLRYFHIRQCVYHANDYLLLALTNLVHLEELKLEQCSNFTTKGLIQFLNQMTYHHPNRSFRKLTIGSSVQAFDKHVLLDVISGRQIDNIYINNNDNNNSNRDPTIISPPPKSSIIATTTTSYEQQQQQPKLLLEELTLDQPYKIKLRDVAEFLEIMRHDGKTMKKLHLVINDFFDAPDFLQMDQGKAFLDNLDHVAKEWTFVFRQETVQEAVITHYDYRIQQRNKKLRGSKSKSVKQRYEIYASSFIRYQLRKSADVDVKKDTTIRMRNYIQPDIERYIVYE